MAQITIEVSIKLRSKEELYAVVSALGRMSGLDYKERIRDSKLDLDWKKVATAGTSLHNQLGLLAEIEMEEKE